MNIKNWVDAFGQEITIGDYLVWAEMVGQHNARMKVVKVLSFTEQTIVVGWPGMVWEKTSNGRESVKGVQSSRISASSRLMRIPPGVIPDSIREDLIAINPIIKGVD